MGSRACDDDDDVLLELEASVWPVSRDLSLWAGERMCLVFGPTE